MIYIYAVGLAFVLSYLLTIMMIKLSQRYGIYDFPSERKVHRDRVPILGGFAIIIAFFVTETTLFIAAGIKVDSLLLLFLCYLPILAISLYDDIREISVHVRLAVQIISVLAIVVLGPRLEYLPLPWGGRLNLGVLSIAVTAIWYLVLINGFNFIDGLDGLAAGISAIAAFFIFIPKNMLGDSQSALLCLGLLGASLGFLRFNFHPAKIFMGDTGANFLGFTFAAISLFGQGKTVVFTSLLMPIAALGLPIIDVGHRIIRRTKDKKSLFQSARDHIHHRFMDMGFKQKWVVVEFYLLTAIMGGMGLFLLVQNRLYIYIFSTLFLIFSIIWFKNRR